MLRSGDILDDTYRVVSLIGEGGMGAVYEGHNVRLNRRVAIKVMHPAIAGERDAVMRFEREAKAAARIGSKHVVDVIDLGESKEGLRYMVMEYLEGQTLSTRLRGAEPVPVPEVAAIGIQLLDGLAKVHDAGIVHRDLKPANVFLVRDPDGVDFVKILDFGVCKIPREKKTANEVSTGVGDLLGTPAYMAPEQLEHGPTHVDARSDLYGVGVLLFRAASGRLPYKAKDFVELVMALREKRNPPLGEALPGVDPGFAAIVDRAIEWDAAARWQSAREFRRALASWLRKAANVDRLLLEFLDDEGDAEATGRSSATAEPPHAAPARAAPSRGQAPTADVGPASAPASGPASAPASGRRVSARPPASPGKKALRVRKKLPPVQAPPPRKPKRDPRPSMSDAETGRFVAREATSGTHPTTGAPRPPQQSELDIDIEVDLGEEASTARAEVPEVRPRQKGR